MVFEIMMDCGYCVHRRSVWGYLLAKVIAPFVNRSAQAIVACQFAYVVVLPGLYKEAMAQLVTDDHSSHFLDPAVSSIAITRISVAEVLSPNFGRDCILNNLIIVNCIPLEWIRHSFYFGFHYLLEHLVTMDHHYEEHCAAYGKMLDLLDSNGELPSYPPWDGWFHPSVHDWERIHVLRFLELQQNIHSRESPHWLHIGEAPIVTNLVFGPNLRCCR